MENQEKTTLDRVLKEQHLKDAEKAIKGGEKTGSLKNPKLIKELIKGFKGKTVHAPVEVIIVSAIFLNVRELMGTIEALKHTLHIKMAEELKEKADKGKATAEDAIAALMLATIMDEENSKEKYE